MPRLEFFYDCSSPWTYLAFHRIEALAAETGALLVWRPILVGGVFNAINGSVYEQRANPVPAKQRYHGKDLMDWARLYGLEIHWPTVFPVNSVRAMRGCLHAESHGRIADWSRAVFEAYWGAGLDISQDDVLTGIAERTGLDPALLLREIGGEALKSRLREQTQELIDRGGFGSPTMFVNGDDLYFGNDRLILVEHALRKDVDAQSRSA